MVRGLQAFLGKIPYLGFHDTLQNQRLMCTLVHLWQAICGTILTVREPYPEIHQKVAGLSQKGDWLRPTVKKPNVMQKLGPVPVPFLRQSQSGASNLFRGDSVVFCVYQSDMERQCWTLALVTQSDFERHWLGGQAPARLSCNGSSAG